jgi:hypothetical protein
MASEKQRTIGIAMDYSPSSKAATRWVVGNLVKAGDRIILIHVLPKGAIQHEIFSQQVGNWII